jgi:hypothetical protein
MADELVVGLATIAPRTLVGSDVSSGFDAVTFQRHIESSVSSPWEEVGTLLMLAALVDFVLHGRSVGTEPTVALRAKQWARTLASWTAIRREVLSPEAIESYLDEILEVAPTALL